MKNQASIQLLKVGTPINPNADTGHIMLCADADGNLRIFGENGVELPIGSAVDESRLVPTGGQGGNLLEYQEGVDRGNNVNTKLLLQPATSDGQIVDQAAGNAAPVSITNSGNVVIEDNALVFTGTNSLLIPANALGMTLGGNNEFTIDIEFQLDSVKSDYATLYGSDGGSSSSRGALYFTSSGAATFTDSLGPNTTGWTLGTKHRITIERWNDNGTWKTSVYRNGSFLASSTAGMNILSNYAFPIGSNNEGTGRNFVGKIWAFRISNKAEHRGVSFTPRELPFLPPAGQPVWTEGIDRSRLLKVPTSADEGKLPVIRADKIPAVYHDTTLAAIVIEGDKVIDKISGKELTKVGNPQIVGGGIHSPTNSDYYMLELEGVEGLPVAVSFDYQGDESSDNSDIIIINGTCAYYNLNGVSFCRTQGGGNNVKIDNEPIGVSAVYRNYVIQVSSDNYESKTPPVAFIAGESKSPTYEGSFPSMSPLSSVKVCGRFGKIKNILISSAFPYTGNFTPRGDGVEGFGVPEKREPGWNYETLDEAANGRLLPANPANGDIPCFDVTGTVGKGNDETVKFLLQPATSENAIADSAKGNTTPTTVNNNGLVVDDEGVMSFTTSTYATIPANSLPNDVLLKDHEWTIDILFNIPTDETSRSPIFWGNESSDCQFWAMLDGNDARFVTTGNAYYTAGAYTKGTWALMTVEHFYNEETSGWSHAVYLNGVRGTLAKNQLRYNLRERDIMIGRRSSGSNTCKGQIKVCRIRNNAPYKGNNFTPDEFPYIVPVPVGEWSTINKSALVQSVNGHLPDESGNVTVETGSTVDESRLLPDSGPDDSWMHHSESMDLVTPTDMTSMQSVDWILTAENVQNNFSCKPWGLFDSFANSGYLFSTTTGPSNCTWTRRDGTPTLIDRLELYAGSASQRNRDSYEFYGSHNGSDWILLGSWENTNWSADSVGYDNGDYYVLTLEVNNDIKYLHYKFVSPSTSLNGLKGYGVTTKNEWKKFPVATDSAAGLMSAADKAKLDGISTSEAWYTVADAAAITLDRANGELQKVTLTQNCVLTAPVLDAGHSTLLLQVTSSSAVTVTVGETNIVTDHTGTFQVGWYWDGEATRRYPAVEIS